MEFGIGESGHNHKQNLRNEASPSEGRPLQRDGAPNSFCPGTVVAYLEIRCICSGKSLPICNQTAIEFWVGVVLLMGLVKRTNQQLVWGKGDFTGCDQRVLKLCCCWALRNSSISVADMQRAIMAIFKDASLGHHTADMN